MGTAAPNINNKHAEPLPQTALAVSDPREVALRTAIDLWATSSTSATTRRSDELIVKKRKAVRSFFADIGKEPGEVAPADVQEWCERMRKEDGRYLAPATIYARVSFLLGLTQKGENLDN